MNAYGSKALTSREGKTPWYETAFSSLYTDVYPHRDEREAESQVSFVLDKVRLSPVAKILDIGCGEGRHVRQFRRREVRAIGIDLSPDLLSRAKSPPGATRRNVGLFVRGDMRALPFSSGFFDLVTNFFTSFGYFDTDREHLETLREWRRVLRPNAHLFIDYLDRDSIISTLIPRSSERRGDLTLLQERSLVDGGRRIEKRVSAISDTQEELFSYRESVRMFSRDELEAILMSANFLLEKTFSHFEKNASSARSHPRLIILARAA